MSRTRSKSNFENRYSHKLVPNFLSTVIRNSKPMDTPIGRPDFGNQVYKEDRTLLKLQQNQVLEAIKLHDLDPLQFHWEVVPSSLHQRSDVAVSKLTHSSGFYFIFNSTRDNQLWFVRSPGVQGRVEEGTSQKWPQQLVSLHEWLDILKSEVSAPDLWAALRDEVAIVEAAAGDIENRKFDQVEQAKIQASIADLKRLFLEKNNVTAHQLEFFSSQMQYLSESSSRVGRKDWLMLALSTLVSVVVALSLPPESSRYLLSLANETLGWVMHSRPLFPIL
jgi:hypothetical protein